MSWKDYKAEALKCTLVCSNCHREIHEGITECPEILPGNNEAVKEASVKFENEYNN